MLPKTKRGCFFSLDVELDHLAREYAWKNRMSFSALVTQSVLKTISKDIGAKKTKQIAERLAEKKLGKWGG